MENEEKLKMGEIVPSNPTEENEAVSSAPVAEEPVAPRTFTQEEVDAIAGKARAEGKKVALKSYLDQYGVESEDELGGLFADGQRYSGLSEEYSASRKENAELKKELALTKATLQYGLDPAVYEDVVAIANSKGLELNDQTIRTLMETRPYWRKSRGNVAPQPAAEGFTNVTPEPAPAPVPAPAEESVEAAPAMAAPEPEPEPVMPSAPQSVLTRLGAKPHASKDVNGNASPLEMAKALALGTGNK